MQADLRAIDMKVYRRPRGPFLTADQKKKRLQFAKKWAAKGSQPGMLFSDESLITTEHCGAQYQWVSHKDNLLPIGMGQDPTRLMLWGGHWHWDKDLVCLARPQKR